MKRATFYFSDDQLLELEVLMLKLRTIHRVRAEKSQLMRLAMDYLLGVPMHELAKQIRNQDGGAA